MKDSNKIDTGQCVLVYISINVGYFRTKQIAELLSSKTGMICCRLSSVYILLTYKLTVVDISLTETKPSTSKDEPPWSAPSAPQSVSSNVPESVAQSVPSSATALQKQLSLIHI